MYIITYTSPSLSLLFWGDIQAVFDHGIMLFILQRFYLQSALHDVCFDPFKIS